MLYTLNLKKKIDSGCLLKNVTIIILEYDKIIQINSRKKKTSILTWDILSRSKSLAHLNGIQRSVHGGRCTPV